MVNEDNKGKGAYTPAVVMLAIGGLGLLLGVVLVLIPPLTEWVFEKGILKQPVIPLFLLIFTLGIVLAVEYGVICLLHRQPETRRKVAWDFLAPTVTILSAGSIVSAVVVIGVQVNSIMSQKPVIASSPVVIDTVPIAQGLNQIKSEIEQLRQLVGGIPESNAALMRQQLNSINSVADEVRSVRNTINVIDVQGGATVRRLGTINESINSLSLPQPLKISVQDGLKPVFVQLGGELKKSAKEIVHAIRTHGAELSKIECIHRGRYERAVNLGKRNFCVKTKHFFGGIK